MVLEQESAERQPALRPPFPGGAFGDLGAVARADFESISHDSTLPSRDELFHENKAGNWVFLLLGTCQAVVHITGREDFVAEGCGGR